MISRNKKMQIARKRYRWLGPFSPIDWIDLTDEEIKRLHVEAKTIKKK